VLDLPRESEIQKRLNLGLTDKILREIKGRRSNVKQVVLEDMTGCTLPSESFDGVVCAEVIEHVPQDHLFVEQIARVLKPGGWLYLTTPNGDYIRNEPPDYNPDHIRHYTRQQLFDLLSSYFGGVKVTYGVKTGKYRYRGQQGLDPRRPLLAIRNMTCNFVNRIESRGLENQHHRTAYLFADAWKKSA
jgi:SAM-dependent methyltransferase